MMPPPRAQVSCDSLAWAFLGAAAAAAAAYVLGGALYAAKVRRAPRAYSREYLHAIA